MKKYFLPIISAVVILGLIVYVIFMRGDRFEIEEVNVLIDEQVELIQGYIDGVGSTADPGQIITKIEAFSQGLKALNPRLNGLLEKFAPGEASASESETKTMATLLALLKFRQNLVSMNLKMFSGNPQVQKARQALVTIQREVDTEGTTIDQEEVKQKYQDLIEGRLEGSEKIRQFSKKMGQASLTSKMKITVNILITTARAVQSFIKDYEYAPEVDSLEELHYYKNFVPLYIKSLVTQDAWGNPLHYKAEGDRFWLGSGGSDGKFEGFDQEGTYTDWQGKDIVLSGSTLTYGPKMAGN